MIFSISDSMILLKILVGDFFLWLLGYEIGQIFTVVFLDLSKKVKIFLNMLFNLYRETQLQIRCHSGQNVTLIYNK